MRPFSARGPRLVLIWSIRLSELSEGFQVESVVYVCVYVCVCVLCCDEFDD